MVFGKKKKTLCNSKGKKTQSYATFGVVCTQMSVHHLLVDSGIHFSGCFSMYLKAFNNPAFPTVWQTGKQDVPDY